MNSRIKELAEKSGLTFDRYGAYVASSLALQETINLQKFAELIVKECINVALTQKLWVEDQKIFNQQDDIWNRARMQQSVRIVDKIKEHFGIDE